jgi:NTP pyrophosphatase (non-canonical NTP hydrolase)
VSDAIANVTTLDGYQAEARRTINRALSDDQRLLDAAAGLAEEAGEVLSHVRKHVMQGRTLDRGAVALELGDALWCLSVAADTLGVSLQDVARLNIEKLRSRYPD